MTNMDTLLVAAGEKLDQGPTSSIQSETAP